VGLKKEGRGDLVGEGFFGESPCRYFHLCWVCFVGSGPLCWTEEGLEVGDPLSPGEPSICVCLSMGRTEQICTQGSIVFLQSREKKSTAKFQGPHRSSLAIFLFF